MSQFNGSFSVTFINVTIIAEMNEKNRMMKGLYQEIEGLKHKLSIGKKIDSAIQL